MTDSLDRFLGRVDTLLDRLEKLLPAGAPAIDWSAGTRVPLAQARRARGFLDAVRHPHAIAFADLLDIDEQKRRAAREHGAVRRRPAGQQRAPHGRARHGQELAREGGAERVRAARACG